MTCECYLIKKSNKKRKNKNDVSRWLKYILEEKIRHLQSKAKTVVFAQHRAMPILEAENFVTNKHKVNILTKDWGVTWRILRIKLLNIK